jgi:hypothetical protein
MTVRWEIKLAVFSLVAVQVVTSFGAIALLGSHAGGAAAEAGAWAMVLLALIGLGASAVVLRRLVTRVAVPVDRIEDALAGFGRGDGFRRCRLDAAPAELTRIAASISTLIDSRSAGEEDPREVAAADRAALLHFLDGMAAPAIVVSRRGIPTAGSASALARLETDPTGALKRALEATAASGRAAAGVASVIPIANGALFLCTLQVPLRASPS